MLVGEAGGRCRGAALAAALIALVCALAMPAVAGAEFTVNSTGDQPDATLGVGCLLPGEECTLRAAIEEANVSAEEFERIAFDEAVFDGGATSTIALGSSLPTIVHPMVVNGRECPRGPELSGPCVGVDGPAAGPAFVFENATAAEIEGLAIAGAQTGIEVVDTELVGISANWIGVKLDGSAGGNATGVVFGPGADEGRVGGESPGRGNVFANNADDGVDLLGGARVRVLRNSFGVDPDGSDAAGGEEVAVLAGTEAEARIAGNLIFGAETAVEVSGSTGAEGSAIEGNLIEDASASAILIENDLNVIFGNEIVGTGGAGIRIDGSGVIPSTGNLVGGDTEEEENAIFESAGAAIEIVDVEASENEVARNWGAENDGLFIDLVAAFPGSEPNGPNGGIKPPSFSASAQSGAAGSGAKAGAKVRVFRKAGAEAGELESFLGEAVADAGGDWKVAYGAAIPTGTLVVATQTSEAGGTSELSPTATTTPDPTGGGGGSGGSVSSGSCAFSSGCVGGVANVKPAAPQTKIVKGPEKKSDKTTATFKFNSDEAGSSFQCKLDGKRFANCRSPKRYKGLKPGKHLFEVRAINSAGGVDTTPAKRKFTVLG